MLSGEDNVKNLTLLLKYLNICNLKIWKALGLWSTHNHLESISTSSTHQSYKGRISKKKINVKTDLQALK